MVGEALLDGVRVVDLSRVLAGPYAAQVLAELGADVVKVEHPDGDAARGIGPHADGRSLYFSALNSGKRGVVLDLADASGRAGLTALFDRAEIAIHNLRPDAAARLGCDEESLRARHPGLTVVTVTSYASDSDRAGVPALDLTAQAEAGVMAVTGEPGGVPVRAGVPVGDLATGLWAALAAVSGHVAATRDGCGRHVEVPLVDATMSLLSYVGTAAAWTGEEPAKVGSGHHSVVPYGGFPTADGWVVLAVIGDRFWPLTCEALGLGDLAGRDDLATNAQRHARRGEVEEAVARALAEMTTGDALERLRAAGVPASPVLSVLDAIGSPYARDRGIVAEVPAPEGTYRLVRGPVRSGRPLGPAPALGQHTAEVMGEVLGEDSPHLGRILARVPGQPRSS